MGASAAGNVSRRHFELAFEAVKPSVGEADRKKYEAMKKRWENEQATLRNSNFDQKMIKKLKHAQNIIDMSQRPISRFGHASGGT